LERSEGLPQGGDCGENRSCVILLVLTPIEEKRGR
jgi:hypothetical protein